MKLQLPRSYKLLLSLALVAGPFIWLVLTEDGQRRSDLFILHVLGKPGFNVAFDRLTPAVTEADIGQQFPKVAFQCEDRPSRLGERVCSAEIASFNGLPARHARLYYGADGLTAMELGYRARYHAMLLESLDAGLGEPALEADASTLRWQAAGGSILLSAEAPATPADAVVMWLSPALTGAP